MTTMMDIVFASFLGGIIILITLNANAVVRETWATYNSDLIVQQMLISNAQIIECEFRNMGCGLDTTQSSITEALDTCIEFRMALRPEINTPIVRIKYYGGNIDELTTTDNVSDRFLYRQVNGGSTQRVGIITQFKLRYFSDAGVELFAPIAANDLNKIRIIEITMEVQSPFAAYMEEIENSETGEIERYEKRYTSALWKQTRLASQNLRR